MNLRWAAVGAVLAGTVGAVSSLAAANARIWLIVAGIVLAPTLAVIASVSAPPLAAFVVFSQIFEAFEIDSPIGNLSVGGLMLLLFLALRWSDVSRALAVPWLRVLFVVLLLFVASHLVEMLHIGPATAARNVVTLTSFGAFWLVGVAVGRSAAGRRALALGSLAALLVLGVLGILVSLGKFPPPTRVLDPRSFFGFVSPFKRNYGLELDFVGTALLLTLCAPWLMLQILRAPTIAGRLGAVLGYGALCFVTLFVFQSRSMLLELGMIPALTLLLTRTPLPIRAAVAGALTVVAIAAVPQFLTADKVSTSNREDSYQYVMNYFRDRPQTLLVGTDVAPVLEEIYYTSRHGHEDLPTTPVHNMFLGEMLRAGLIPVVCLMLLLAVPLWRGWRLLTTSGDGADLGILTWTAVATGLIEIAVNPIEANVAALWLMLGTVAAMSVAKGLPAANRQRAVDRLSFRVSPHSAATRHEQIGVSP